MSIPHQIESFQVFLIIAAYPVAIILGIYNIVLHRRLERARQGHREWKRVAARLKEMHNQLGASCSRLTADKVAAQKRVEVINAEKIEAVRSAEGLERYIHRLENILTGMMTFHLTFVGPKQDGQIQMHVVAVNGAMVSTGTDLIQLSEAGIETIRNRNAIEVARNAANI